MSQAVYPNLSGRNLLQSLAESPVAWTVAICVSEYETFKTQNLPGPATPIQPSHPLAAQCKCYPPIYNLSLELG